ncbi:MAG: hypothetical protein Q9170_003086 [Blastenia crenularia]
MTTPSTTVLVNGTPDAASTSEATSIYDDENPLEDHATRRHQLEQLAVPSALTAERYPSAASFDASLDQLANRPKNQNSSKTASIRQQGFFQDKDNTRLQKARFLRK